MGILGKALLRFLEFYLVGLKSCKSKFNIVARAIIGVFTQKPHVSINITNYFEKRKDEPLDELYNF
jgi:hypothetical protein